MIKYCEFSELVIQQPSSSSSSLAAAAAARSTSEYGDDLQRSRGGARVVIPLNGAEQDAGDGVVDGDDEQIADLREEEKEEEGEGEVIKKKRAEENACMGMLNFTF